MDLGHGTVFFWQISEESLKYLKIVKTIGITILGRFPLDYFHYSN